MVNLATHGPEEQQALRKAVLEQITLFPETHDQADWEIYNNECGTTRCIAGWAVMLAKPGHQSAEEALHYVVQENMDDAEIFDISFNGGGDFFSIGKRLLGLYEFEADKMFLTDDERAIELLKARIRDYDDDGGSEE